MQIIFRMNRRVVQQPQQPQRKDSTMWTSSRGTQVWQMTNDQILDNFLKTHTRKQYAAKDHCIPDEFGSFLSLCKCSVVFWSPRWNMNMKLVRMNLNDSLNKWSNCIIVTIYVNFITVAKIFCLLIWINNCQSWIICTKMQKKLSLLTKMCIRNGGKCIKGCPSIQCSLIRVANSLLSQELKLCFSDTKFTKAPYTKKDTSFF